jgi:dATP pyrophosphohydrolase
MLYSHPIDTQKATDQAPNHVIPQYCFAVLVQERLIGISPEHSEYQWLAYCEAYELVKFDGNRTALWELNKRLQGKGPRG